MQAEWFYADGATANGPLELKDLVAALQQLPNPENAKVWRADFTEWRSAGEVPELATYVIKPQRLSPIEAERVKQPSHTANAVRRSRVDLIIVAAIVLAVGATYSTVIYGNSLAGIVGLVAQLIGAALVVLVIALIVVFASKRRSPYLASIILGIAALSVGIGNFEKLRSGWAALEARQALKDVHDPSQIQKAIDRAPSNAILELTARILQLAQRNADLVAKWSNEIEPAQLSNGFDVSTAGQAELETYRSQFQTAVANSANFMQRYSDLMKEERAMSERIARDMRFDEDIIRQLLRGIDNRHAKFSALNERMMSARTELYRAYANHISFILENFGSYKVVNGRFIFSNQSIVNSFNASAQTLAAAAKLVVNVDAEGQKLLQEQQAGWKRLVEGQ